MSDIFNRTLRRFSDDDDGLVGTFQPADADEDDREPFGVREDYRAAIPGGTHYDAGLGQHPSAGARATAGNVPHEAYTRGPRYFDGDETKPANLHPAHITSIQKAMVNAGLLKSHHVTGIWDVNSSDAYKDVLSVANRQGITDRMALQQMSAAGLESGAAGGAGGGEGGGIIGYDAEGNPIYAPFQAPAPPPLRTTNKKDLAGIFRRAVIDIKGEGWSQEQINELVDAYNWKEIAVQTDLYQDQIAQMKKEYEGGDVTKDFIMEGSVPSPEQFLEDEMMRRDPAGTQAGKIVNQWIPQFMEMMNGWGNSSQLGGQ